MRKAVRIAFAAAVMVPALALAQENRRMLSLDEAVAVTLTENPALKAAAYEERAAQQQRRGTGFLSISHCVNSLHMSHPSVGDSFRDRSAV